MYYLYTHACHEDEKDIFSLERRALFGGGVPAGTPLAFASDREIDPSRSPFLKSRLGVRFEAESPSALADRIREAGTASPSFKVVYTKTGEDVPYAERRDVERVVGGAVRGAADMRAPLERFGVGRFDGRWVFGPLRENDGAWRTHEGKPRQYSTALGIRLARAVVNAAAPEPFGIRAIDPCCGIGTVLLEALSMGVDIVGSDANPLAVRGARENLTHYGYPDVVQVADARRLEGAYDVAIVDLPYNLCSVLPEKELDELLSAVRRLAARAAVVATQPIDAAVRRAGFAVRDRCEARKGAFRREVLLLE